MDSFGQEIALGVAPSFVDTRFDTLLGARRGAERGLADEPAERGLADEPAGLAEMSADELGDSYARDEITAQQLDTLLDTALARPEVLALPPIVKFKRRQSLMGQLRYGSLEVTPGALTIRSGRRRAPKHQKEFKLAVDHTLLHAIFARPNLDHTTTVKLDNYRTELSVTCSRLYPYLLILRPRDAHIGENCVAWVWLHERELTKILASA